MLLVLAAADAHAQSPESPPHDDPFSARRWHAEFALQAALEAWNYNGSHEELYGVRQGVAYGLRDGLMVTAQQRIFYVSQRRNDTWILGLTGGLRARAYQRGRASVFLQFDLGITDAAIAAPPRGTRFNYIAIGGPGVVMRLKSRLDLITSLDVVHISNASLKGPDRNPDIEAIGLTSGLIVGF